MMRCRDSYRGAQLLLAGLFFLLFVCAEDSRAENGSSFGRRRSSVNRGNFNGLNEGNADEVNFRNLEKRINNQFNIDANGRLGVREVRSDGTRQDLFLDGFGRLRGQFARPEARTVQSFGEFAAQNANRFNRQDRVRRFVAGQSGNPQGVLGRMTIDLSSIVPGLLRDDTEPNSPSNALLLKQRIPGSPEQIAYALAVLNQTLNSLSNSSTLMRVRPQNIRRDRDGKPVVVLNLSRFFSTGALATMAASDPGFKCTGKIRLQNLVSTAFDPDTYYRIKGLEGFNRNQIFDALGVEGDKRDTLNNKILIASQPGTGKVESGVTTSPIGRVSKFLNQRNVPGGTCYETDDVIERPPPGEQTNARDARQTGPFYQHDASEVLCHQRNGYMLGMLFDKAGTLQTKAPNDIARGGEILGPTVAAAVSCMDCHAKGFLAGGKKIHQEVNELYNENLGSIPPVRTNFRDRFGRQLNWRDFFTDNRTYRNRANRDTLLYYNSLAKSGGIIPWQKQAGGPVYPQAVIPYAVKQFDKALTAKDMARELGSSEQAVAAIFGGAGGAVDRRTFDNKFCSAKAALGAGSALAGVGRRQPQVGAGQSLRGFQHNATLR